MSTEAEALFAKIKDLSPPDRYRLVAGMLEGIADVSKTDPSKAASLLDMALSVAERTTSEIRVALALARKR